MRRRVMKLSVLLRLANRKWKSWKMKTGWCCQGCRPNLVIIAWWAKEAPKLKMHSIKKKLARNLEMKIKMGCKN